MNRMIQMKDYDGVQGFGVDTMNRVEELNKALTVGYANPPQQGGDVLRTQSLEATLRIVTLLLSHVAFWREISRIPAYSTVEEYNLLNEFGDDSGAFNAAGDLPEEVDSDYERKTAFVKFMGTTRKVDHPATMVRPAHGNVIGLETQNGATWLLQQIEKALFWGRSDNISLEFDGVLKQIMDGVGIVDPNTDLYDATDVLKAGSSTVIIDKRGDKLLENDLNLAANYVSENAGTATDLWATPRALSELAQQFYPRERVNLPLPSDGKVGFAVNSFQSQAGLIRLHQDMYLKSGRRQGAKRPPTRSGTPAATSAKAPSAPTISAAAASSDAKSMFKAGGTGTFYYVVTAINQYGESIGSVASGATAIGVGESSVLTITDVAGTYASTAYRIYRGTSAADAVLMTTVKKAGATTTYTDRNWHIPGCSPAVMLQQNLQSLSFRQLAPMMKIPLATLGPSIRWMQLLYGTPVVYTPRKNVIFLNVGDSVGDK